MGIDQMTARNRRENALSKKKKIKRKKIRGREKERAGKHEGDKMS